MDNETNLQEVQQADSSKQELQPKRLIDLSSVQVVLRFNDNSGFVIPLTDLQGAFLVRTLGITIDEESGRLFHYTDKEMSDIYHIEVN